MAKNAEGVFCGDKKMIFLLPLWMLQIALFGRVKYGRHAE
jgi:hypothetical protein